MARDWSVFKVDLHVDGRVPGRARKRIIADLRDTIDAEAQTNDLSVVLAGLGRPKDLAASYTEGAGGRRVHDPLLPRGRARLFGGRTA